MRALRKWIGIGLFTLAIAGCEEFGGELSAKTLAAMQARTRRLSEINADLKAGGAALRTVQAEANEVRVPMRMRDGLPHIQVSVGSLGSTSLLFDTGASFSVLGPKEALKSGASFVDGRDVKQILARGVFGTENFLPALVPNWKVGDWSVGTMPILVPAERAVLAPGVSLKIMGFYAPKVQCSYVSVNYLKNEIVFGFQQPYQPSGYSQVRSSSMSARSGVPKAKLRVGNVSWDAILDTGSFNGVEISQAVANLMGRGQDGVGVQGIRLSGVGGTKTAEEVGLRYISVPALEMGGMIHRNAQIDIAPGPPRVGSFFFQDYKVTFDLRNSKLWLEW